MINHLEPVFAALPFWLMIVLGLALAPALFFLLFTGWVWYRFMPTITRVFEETPIFRPPDETALPDREDVQFQAPDGIVLQGSWLLARHDPAVGTVIFCHEYLSNRWSCRPYCEPLRSLGFHIFTFDFRNHGESDSLPGYSPMQWASRFELVDLRAAVEHVRGRAPHGNAWVGLLGVSRGGSAAILAAAEEPAVRAVVTDGAFPTHLTQLSYMKRWAGIYVGNARIYQFTPAWYYSFLCALARHLGGRRHGCSFPNVETAMRKLSPRPLLMIHGEKDSYVVPDIARQLFRLAGEPKEFWMAPGAKHNGAILAAPQEYAQRLETFLRRAVGGESRSQS